MIHLKSITIKTKASVQTSFPFNIPVIQSLRQLEFKASVTFLVGENGSGKSTLLEAIACAVGSVTVGSESVEHDQSLLAVRKLAKEVRLSWTKRTPKGFFLRAEDFFGYAKRLAQLRADLEQELSAIEQEYRGRSAKAKGLARMPYMRELSELERSYGEGLDSYSHGESFLTLFQSRFVPGGLYLLDEPEAPLSPMRQLAFLSLLKQMVQQDAQFIIATHSPIIMAFPDATILNFDSLSIQEVNYTELEHVTLTKEFLNNPQSFLRHL